MANFSRRGLLGLMAKGAAAAGLTIPIISNIVGTEAPAAESTIYNLAENESYTAVEGKLFLWQDAIKDGEVTYVEKGPLPAPFIALRWVREGVVHIVSRS